MEKFNLIGIAANVSRVYEISKAGNHSVRIIPAEGIHLKDVELFNQFYGFEQVDHPEILIELNFSPSDILSALFISKKFETLDDINNRVAKNEFSEIEVKDGLNSACINLLKAAFEKLQLGVNDVIVITRLSKTIARLAESSTIQAEHIAEAILYRSIPM